MKLSHPLILVFVLAITIASAKKWSTNKDSIIIEADYEDGIVSDDAAENIECRTIDREIGQCVSVRRCHPILFTDEGALRNKELAETFATMEQRASCISEPGSINGSAIEIGDRTICCAVSKLLSSLRSGLDEELEMWPTTVEPELLVQSQQRDDIEDSLVSTTVDSLVYQDNVVVEEEPVRTTVQPLSNVVVQEEEYNPVRDSVVIENLLHTSTDEENFILGISEETRTETTTGRSDLHESFDDDQQEIRTTTEVNSITDLFSKVMNKEKVVGETFDDGIPTTVASILSDDIQTEVTTSVPEHLSGVISVEEIVADPPSSSATETESPDDIATTENTVLPEIVADSVQEEQSEITTRQSVPQTEELTTASVLQSEILNADAPAQTEIPEVTTSQSVTETGRPFHSESLEISTVGSQTEISATSESASVQPVEDYVTPLSVQAEILNSEVALEPESPTTTEITKLSVSSESEAGISLPSTAAPQETTSFSIQPEISTPESSVPLQQEISNPESSVPPQQEISTPESSVPLQQEISIPESSVPPQQEISTHESAISPALTEIPPPESSVSSQPEISSSATPVSIQQDVSTSESSVSTPQQEISSSPSTAETSESASPVQPEIPAEPEEPQADTPFESCHNVETYNQWPVFQSYPFLASILTRSKSGPLCSGSLIDSRHVLTAAHCLHRFNSRDVAGMQVRLGFSKHVGNDTLEHHYLERRASKVIIHKHFHAQNKMDNNIAIVQLNKPVIFDEHVSAINIFREAPGYDQANCSASQAGFIRYGNRIVTEIGDGFINFIEAPMGDFFLRESISRVYSPQECKSELNSQVTEKMVCARPESFETEGMTNIFKGNDGGPLLIKDGNRVLQIGIKSWAYEGNRYPTVYTRIDSYFKWIADNLKM